MAQTARTFRIFVSSTFSDVKEERNALQKYVYPRLRELCLRHGTRFQAIDLRWGVSEEAGLDQQTMNICLDEISRCRKASPRPNFIVLLGDRYGWCPLPPQIPALEFEQILEKVSSEERELLLWDERQPVGQEGWYRRDNNAVPPEYVLRPREGAYEDHQRWAKVEGRLHAILENAVKAMPLETYDRLKYEVSATAQEIAAGALRVEGPEKHVGCFFRSLVVPDENGASHPIHEVEPEASMRDFIDLDSNGNLNSDAHRKLDALTNVFRQLLPNNIHDYEARWLGEGISTDHIGYLPENLDECLALLHAPTPPHNLCNDVWRWLARMILDEITRLEQKGPLTLEIETHKKFAEDRARNFVGREDILEEITNYLKNSLNHHPLVIYGESGSGKSALIAKMVEQAKHQHSDAIIISRLIGATPTSSDGRSLLESLCQQIPMSFGADETTPTEYQDLVSEFAKCLAYATAERPLLLFLDALDQLSATDNAHSLTWLPRKLPQHVKLVVSTLDRDDEAGECLRVLRGKLPEESFIRLAPLDRVNAEHLLQTWQDEVNRTLQPAQRQEVLGKFGSCPLPLYLKLAFEESRHWHSYDGVPCYQNEPGLGKDIPAVIRNLFWRLSRPTRHGDVLVSRALGYLAAARYGLAEDELLDVLSRDIDVYGQFLRNSWHIPPDLFEVVKRHLQNAAKDGSGPQPSTPIKDASVTEWLRAHMGVEQLRGILEILLPRPDGPRLPVVLWSRLYSDLAPYLTERRTGRAVLLGFYHRQVQEVVESDYLGEGNREGLHANLASYFKDQPLWVFQEGTRISNLRKVTELPYQMAKGSLWADLEHTLVDLEFLEAKCLAGLGFDLLRDIDRDGVLEECPDLVMVRRAVSAALGGVTQAPQYCLPMIWNRLQWLTSTDAVGTTLQLSLEKATRSLRDVTWLRADAPLPDVTHERPHTFPLEMTSIQSLSMRTKRLAVASNDPEITVLDILTGEPLSRQSFDGPRIRNIALAEDEAMVAVLTTERTVRYGATESRWRAREREQLIACVDGPEVVYVRDDNHLIAWSPLNDSVQVLASDLPAPLVVLRKSDDGSHILFVAGYRKQVCGIATKAQLGWTTSLLSNLSAPIVAGDLDELGERAVLATADSRVLIVAKNDGKLLGPWAYQNATSSRLRGMAKFVSYGAGPTARTIFLGTNTGQVWNWNPSTGESQPYGAVRSRREAGDLLCAGVWPDSGLPFVTTDLSAQTLAPEEQLAVQSEPITAICFDKSGLIVAASHQAQSVSWYTSHKLRQKGLLHVPWPLTLTPEETSDSVWVGSETGQVSEIVPGQTLLTDHSFLVANPVIGLQPVRHSQMIWVAEANGDINCMPVVAENPSTDKARVEILWTGSGFEKRLKAIPASADGTFWCMTATESSHEISVECIDTRQKSGTPLKGNDILDIAVSQDKRLLAVVGSSIEVYDGRDKGWHELYSSKSYANLLVFAGDGKWLVLARGRWLELRRVAPGLPLEAAQDLPSDITCLASRGRAIAAGLRSGEVVSFLLE